MSTLDKILWIVLVAAMAVLLTVVTRYGVKKNHECRDFCHPYSHNVAGDICFCGDGSIMKWN